ncbi:hypothetical protein BD414DRAFT_484642 [Trametes punicea]|nr:hypothetical protein BD414DRAFT_484642 [Trametes punicea]
MSSPARALAPVAQPASKEANVKKRVLADSDTEQRDVKRPKPQSELANEPQRDAKEKKKRRKKRRKLSVVHPQPASEMEGLVASKASGSRSRSRSMTLARSSSLSPEPNHVESDKIGAHSLCAGPSTLLSRDPSPSHSSSSKGKARATPDGSAPQDTQQRITDLRDQVSAKANLVSQHENLLSAFQHSLSCQICLDLMHRPFALAPCGHSACYQCLVNWFRAPPPDVPANEVLPVWLRKKTCPHCRAVVKERPIEIWTIKEMVASLIKSGLAAASLPPPPSGPALDAAADPWSGIFRPAPNRNQGVFPDGQPPALLQQLMGLRDDEDGGIYRCIDCHHEIWDGACSECGRVYPGHDPHGHDADEFDEEDGGGLGHWLDPTGDWDDDDDDDDYDPGLDGAWAGLEMLRHMFGVGRRDLDEESSGGESHDEHEGAGLVRGGSARIEEIDHDRGEGGGDGEEEGYESSFIDDGDADDGGAIRRGSRGRNAPRLRRRAPSVDLERDNIVDLAEGDGERQGQDDDEVRFVGFGRRQATAHARGRGPMVISSDEEDDDAEIGDENFDDDDGDLAAEVAARERELYGDDGSVTRGGAPYDTHWPDDEDDEDSGGGDIDYGTDPGDDHDIWAF